MESKKFLTAEEVATEFGLEQATIQQFVDSGELKALADRGTWKYRRDELQALVESGKVSPAEPDLWFDDPKASENQVITVNTGDQDDLSYIELDEEALAEHATMISKSSPISDDSSPDDWFVTSPEGESNATSAAPSSSDVRAYSEDAAHEATLIASAGLGENDEAGLDFTDLGSSDADAPPARQNAASDSDINIGAEVPGGMLEGSGIALDFDLGAGATVSSSGSSLRLPQTALTDESDAVWGETQEPQVQPTGMSGLALSDSSISPAGGSSIRLDDDSSLSVLGMEESGIALDGSSHIGLPSTGSSVVSSGSSVVTAAGGGSGNMAGDSGISLESADDSGLSLESFHEDSGLSLIEEDSGLSLEPQGDSGISLTSPDKTQGDDAFAATMISDGIGDKTQTIDLSNDLDDDSAFDLNLSDSAATSELQIDDEDDFDETAATVVKKGRGQTSPGLTDAFQLDDAPEVEELDIADDLDAGDSDADGQEAAVAEEVFEATDETFSDEIEATDDDEEYAESTPTAKSVGPREPSWGAGMSVGLIACTLVLVANGLILWSGVSTMWTGTDATGPAASLITQLAGLIGN